jgi:hypothetical protein
LFNMAVRNKELSAAIRAAAFAAFDRSLILFGSARVGDPFRGRGGWDCG